MQATHLPSLFGHAQRRALAARTLTRPEWRALCRSVRFERRTGAERGTRIGRELARLTGCDIGHFLSRADVLDLRFWTLAGGTNRVRTSPLGCNGLPALRALLAVTWYPTRASKFAPKNHHLLAGAQ